MNDITDLIPRDGLPDWVRRWLRARGKSYSSKEEAQRAGILNPEAGLDRRFRDFRPFPQQRDALFPIERPDSPFYNQDAWVQESEYSEKTVEKGE